MSSLLQGIGPGGGYRFSRNAGRSLTGESHGTVRYPHPFFDIASTYMPSNIKTLLKWCRYYFMTNPLINAVCYKMAEYPVTDLIFETKNSSLRSQWESFFRKTLKFKKFEVEADLDYNAYGNCFISLSFPFYKFLVCEGCKKWHRIDKVKYTFRSFDFHGECESCAHHGKFKVVDYYVKSARDIRLIRWNPENITIRHNEATGELLYYYSIPSHFRNDIQLGKRHTIERTPQAFIDALKKNKSLLLNKNNIYHMRRPTLSEKDKGWGLPMILPVLKDTFFVQILRKAQETIAIEHAVPMRAIFPQMASGTSDPYASVNLSSWKRKVEQEIVRWRLDNNYIPIMPLPIGQQTLGADGKALMLSQEYRVHAESIVAGMGVPIEFVFGGMQYSGSNVSLRILENHFLDRKAYHHELVDDFIIPNVAAYMDWEPTTTRFTPFKLADDLQRSAFNLQLNQAMKISDQTLLESTDWDSTKEGERIRAEQQKQLENQRSQALAQAAIQGESQLVMQKFQFRGQRALEQNMPQQPGMGGPLEQPPQPPGPTGVPGMASPAAQGAELNAQQGAANQQGAVPPLDNAGMLAGMQPPPAGLPAEAGSQLGADQKMDAPPGQMPSMDLHQVAQAIASHLDQMQEAERQQVLSQLRKENPELYALVAPMVQERLGAHQSSAAAPHPQQRAPRRGPEATTV